jgi:hypothetical protein
LKWTNTRFAGPTPSCDAEIRFQGRHEAVRSGDHRRGADPFDARARAGCKLEDLFRLPSVRHYLIVKTENRTIMRHARDADGVILTRIVREGPIALEPQSITLTNCFPPEGGGAS